MIIGVPTEVKNNENRVGLTPLSVKQIVNSGHDVLIQKKSAEQGGEVAHGVADERVGDAPAEHILDA